MQQVYFSRSIAHFLYKKSITSTETVEVLQQNLFKTGNTSTSVEPMYQNCEKLGNTPTGGRL